MPANAIAFIATVILLFPMGYLFLASPAFLLVRLSIPQVTMLLRGMFSVYFLMVIAAGLLATVAFAATAHPLGALALALLTGFAFIERRWFLGRMDRELQARDAGDAQAPRRLRLLHLGGMAVNALLLAAVAASVPLIA
jgi:hypothetical protein